MIKKVLLRADMLLDGQEHICQSKGDKCIFLYRTSSDRYMCMFPNCQEYLKKVNDKIIPDDNCPFKDAVDVKRKSPGRPKKFIQ